MWPDIVAPDPTLGRVMVESSKGLHRVMWSRLPSILTINSASKAAKVTPVVFIFHFIHPKRKHHRLEEIHDTFEVLEDRLQVVSLKW